jgi:hypothetical protein
MSLPVPNQTTLTISKTLQGTGQIVDSELTRLYNLISQSVSGKDISYELPAETISLINLFMRRLDKVSKNKEHNLFLPTENKDMPFKTLTNLINGHNRYEDYLNKKHAVKNSVIHNINKIISSPSNQIHANTPVTVDNLHSAANNAATKYAEYLGRKIGDNDLSSYDMMSYYQQQFNASVGKDDVGIAANGLKGLFALTSYYNNYFKNRIPTKETKNIKPGVSELFEFNPELANAIYEALGFGKDSNYYEGDIKPEPNTIFVFGSNPEGRHGAGAAKVAREQFGAVYGQGEGLQGNAYALPTKDLRVKENRGFKSISPEQITNSIKKLYEVAKQNPDKQFKVAYRNTTDTSLNGYTGLEMIEMFNAAGPIPSNVIFSKEWVDTGKLNTQSEITPQQKQQAQQLYSEYLDTIFPNSKVKDIVYHGTNENIFDKFSDINEGKYTTDYDKGKGHWFLTKFNDVSLYGKNKITALINLVNPRNATTDYDHKGNYNPTVTTIHDPTYERNLALENNNDGAIIDTLEGETRERQIVVFKPEQIHILGSKQDIEGFKEFVKDKESTVPKGEIDLNRLRTSNKTFKKSYDFVDDFGNEIHISIGSISDVVISRAQELALKEVLGPEYNKTLNNAAVLMSSFTSAATDNAKELIMAKINASTKLASMHAYMMALGFTLDQIVEFMTSETSSLIINESTDNIYYDESPKSITGVIDKLKEDPKINQAQLRAFEAIYKDSKEFTALTGFLGINQKRKADT